MKEGGAAATPHRLLSTQSPLWDPIYERVSHLGEYEGGLFWLDEDDGNCIRGMSYKLQFSLVIVSIISLPGLASGEIKLEPTERTWKMNESYKRVLPS